MRKIWAIAWKELYTTFTNRNLVLIMIVTPLVLSTIMGLAFGGVGGSDSITIAEIPIVVVNLDEGMSLSDTGGTPGGTLDETLPAGIFSDTNPLAGDGQTVNFGDQLTSILAPSAGGEEDSSEEGSSEDDGGFELPPCRLVEERGEDDATAFSGSLDDLFATTLLDDVAAARAGVEAGDYVAAIIIPATFSNSLNPFTFGPADEVTAADAAPVEIYANHGEPILGGIARSVVESIVSQFVRSSVALGAMGDSVGGRLEPALAGLSEINPDDVPAIDAPLAEWRTFTSSLSGLSPWFAALSNVLTNIGQDDATGSGSENGTGIGAVLTCIFDPNFNTITVERQPVNELQEQNLLSQIMVQIGSAQAVFFALFTGVFGLLSIYDERRQWTLQRMLASPTPSSSVLFGKVAGNLVVVWMQLALLMVALTLVTSLLTRMPTFIWGGQFGLLFLLTLALTLCVTGIGVLIVGIARTPEQVQVFGPVINMTLGALGGAFGFAVPAAFASLSLITWGVDAFQSLAAGQTDIWLNLAVLAGQGIVFFGVGLWLFRRRVQL